MGFAVLNLSYVGRRDLQTQKTPPGIGRRLDSVVQRSFEAILHENSGFSIPVARVSQI
jgi:hypothetical protein